MIDRRATTIEAAPSNSPWSMLLTLAGIAGYAWRLVTADYGAVGARPSTELLYACIAGTLGVAILLGPARRGWKHVRARPELLVPFGCFLLGSYLMGLLPWMPERLDVLDPARLWSEGIAERLLVVAALLFAGFYLVWQTKLIVASLETDRGALARSFRASFAALGRGIAAAFFAILGFLLLMSLALLLSPAGFLVSGGVMALLVIPWNFLTLGWLPIVVTSRTPFFRTLHFASQRSWQLGKRWGLLIWAWMISLGYFAYFGWTTRVHTEFGGTITDTTTHSYLWSFELKWLGVYPTSSDWYAGLVEAAKVPSDDRFALPLQLLFLGVALAVMSVVVRCLRETGSLGLQEEFSAGSAAAGAARGA